MSEMSLCDSGHNQIVYYVSGRYSGCPLCKANETIEQIEACNKTSQEAIDSLTTDVERLEEELQRLAPPLSIPAPSFARRKIAFLKSFLSGDNS